MMTGLGWIGQWLNSGVFLLYPCWSEDTYWERYWKAKHAEQRDYGGRCSARWAKGEPHAMKPGKTPEPEDSTFSRRLKWVGGF